MNYDVVPEEMSEVVELDEDEWAGFTHCGNHSGTTLCPSFILPLPFYFSRSVYCQRQLLIVLQYCLHYRTGAGKEGSPNVQCCSISAITWRKKILKKTSRMSSTFSLADTLPLMILATHVQPKHLSFVCSPVVLFSINLWNAKGIYLGI